MRGRNFGFDQNRGGRVTQGMNTQAPAKLVNLGDEGSCNDLARKFDPVGRLALKLLALVPS